MEARILRVVKCGECFAVKSEKSEGGVLNKRVLVLQELGGKYEPTYVATVLGNLATLQYIEGDIVIATLKFQAREYNGQMFMDVVATEIVKR
jgi:FMN-dependent NADH-azoreductase